jgi:hypothetical protein
MPNREVPKVRPFLRVLAWVLVVFIVLGIAAAIRGLIDGDLRPMGRGEAATALLGALLIVPLAFFVAFTGRPPRWLKRLDEFTDYDRPIGREGKGADERKD